MKRHLVMVGHEKGVGKDTFATIFVTQLRLRNIDVVRIGFADKVKDTAHLLFKVRGMRNRFYYDANYADRDKPLACGKTPRYYWIELGNKVRAIDDKIWFDCAVDNAAQIIVIPDFRYPAEGDYADLSDFVVHKVKVHRVTGNTTDVADDALATYEGWDHHLYNNGTVEEYTKLCTTFALDFFNATIK